MRTMIRLSIRTKLAILLGGLALLLTLIIMFGVQTSFDRGFHHYLNEAHSARMMRIATHLSELAQDPDQWQRLQQERRFLFETVYTLIEQEYAEQAPSRQLSEEVNRRPLSGRHLSRRAFALNRLMPFWLLSPDGQVLAGSPELRTELLNAPIEVDGQVYGLLAWRPIQARDFEAEALFAQQQQRLIMGVAALALLLSLSLSLPLSHYLVRPIQRLSLAMQALMARRYDTRVPVTSHDELGDLAEDFNRMARTLGAYDDSQRQWLADIAHELRTPLAVLQGQLEAMEDGVMELDQKAIQSLQDEIRQLNGLVDDLHQLAITDLGAMRYHFERLDLNRLLTETAERLQNQLRPAQLTLSLELAAQPFWIRGDRQRLEQMLQNLVQNSIRYTDPGGRVRVRLAANGRLSWEDSAPGVEEQDLPHLFERFYRVDKSRQRALGGSGLGLSIVSNIIKAHQGQAVARHSELGGLCIEVQFPGSTSV